MRSFIGALVLFWSGAAQASVLSFDAYPRKVYWGDAQGNGAYVSMELQWYGELNGGIYGAHFTKVTEDGYAANGAITGTVIYYRNDPLYKMVNDACSWERPRRRTNGVLESQCQQRYSCFISWSGTGQPHYWNRVLYVDWVHRVVRWSDQSQNLLLPIVDANGNVIYSPTSGGDVGWSEQQRSWYEGLFIPSQGAVDNLKAAVDRLKSAGPFGDVAEIRERLAHESLAGAQPLDHSWVLEFQGVHGEQYDVSVETNYADPSMQLVGGLNSGGQDGSSPWLNAVSLGDFRAVLKTLLGWGSWVLFVAGLLLWAKGKWVA